MTGQNWPDSIIIALLRKGACFEQVAPAANRRDFGNTVRRTMRVRIARKLAVLLLTPWKRREADEPFPGLA